MARFDIIRVDEFNDAVLPGGKRIAAFPGQILLQILPHPLSRIDLGRVRGLALQDYIPGPRSVLVV